jgi:hypothetical protein
MQPQNTTSPAVQSMYEYRVEQTNPMSLRKMFRSNGRRDHIQHILNEYGIRGWRLVAVDRGCGLSLNTYLIFERGDEVDSS